MPASGMPVASTITSMPGCAISACASSVTCVARRFSASPSDGAATCSAGQPAVASWLLARSTLRSATRDDVQAARQPRLRQEHGAELAGADQADGDGLARRFALEKEGMKVHNSSLSNNRTAVLVETFQAQDDAP